MFRTQFASEDRKVMNLDMRSGLLEREESLDRLQDCLADLREGEGRVVSLSGEAGIGKSSLVRAFVQSGLEEVLLAQGRPDQLATAGPIVRYVAGAGR
jgi:predicted ATPase